LKKPAAICRRWFSCSRFSCRSFARCAETPTGSVSYSRSSCVDVSLLSYGAASQSSRFVTPNPIGRRTDKFASAAIKRAGSGYRPLADVYLIMLI